MVSVDVDGGNDGSSMLLLVLPLLLVLLGDVDDDVNVVVDVESDRGDEEMRQDSRRR